jgi:hypothetical protein
MQAVFVILYYGCCHAHYIIHTLSLLQCSNLIFGATDYTTAIDMWSVGCILGVLLGQVGFCICFVDFSALRFHY